MQSIFPFIQHDEIVLDSTFVNIDNILEKLRPENSTRAKRRISGTHWPEISYSFREKNVISNQLWLHQISYYTVNQTFNLFESYCIEEPLHIINYYSSRIIVYYNYNLKLNIIQHQDINPVRVDIFGESHSFCLSNYIDYLQPLAKITSKSIIATIVVRANYSEILYLLVNSSRFTQLLVNAIGGIESVFKKSIEPLDLNIIIIVNCLKQ